MIMLCAYPDTTFIVLSKDECRRGLVFLNHVKKTIAPELSFPSFSNRSPKGGQHDDFYTTRPNKTNATFIARRRTPFQHSTPRRPPSTTFHLLP